jgi:anti-sigma factor RsiW
MNAPRDFSCPFSARLKASVDGELRNPGDARAAAEHLAVCPVCTELAHDFAAVRSKLVGALAPVPPPPSPLEIAVRAAGLDRDRRGAVRFLQTVAAVAALVCIVAGVLVLSTASPASGSDSSWRDSTLEVVLNDMVLVGDP